MTRVETGPTRSRVGCLQVGEPARVPRPPLAIVLAPSRSLSRNGRARCATAALCLAPLAADAQIANSEALVDLVARPGGAGVGVLFSSERSPYRGAGQRSDVQPVYLYEGARFFLRSDRVGLKFVPFEGLRLETYLRRRIEGFPFDDPPPSLQGMKPRDGGVDLGLTWRLHAGVGQAYVSATQNLGHQARGQELSLGAHTDWAAGRWILRPAASVTWRSSRSNDFYVGVPPDQATPERPAYEPAAGVDVSTGLFVSYQLTQAWRLVGGVNATRYSSTVRASPIAEPGTQLGVVAGATYSLGADQVRQQVATSPTWVRLLYGRAAEDRCDIVLIATLRCTTINDVAPTEIIGVTLGKTLVENLNDWPLDIVGYAGLIVHHDRPFQRDGAELNLFLKAFFRGLPWSDRVLTRLGFGWGISLADPVPYAEVAEQASRERLVSRLLNYIEPSIDVSLGDLAGKPEWKQTFVGLSVTHRSGMFGNSQLLGKVDGGSNYITLYLEHPF